MQKKSTKSMSPLRRARLERTVCLVIMALMGVSSFVDPNTLF